MHAIYELTIKTQKPETKTTERCLEKYILKFKRLESFSSPLFLVLNLGCPQ